ncbi:MAG: hypothetical protein QM765_12915 [Myxococcales bacterium]
MAALVADPALRRRMGLEGRLFVERELTLKALLENHAALYRDMLSVRSGLP